MAIAAERETVCNKETKYRLHNESFNYMYALITYKYVFICYQHAQVLEVIHVSIISEYIV